MDIRQARFPARLIDNILDSSKIESGAKIYRFERADLVEVISDTLRSLEVSLRHRGFHLGFEAPAAASCEAEVDSDAVAQALANLVDNAVKYSNGAKEIRVRLAREGQEAVDMQIAKLREKIEDRPHDPEFLVTVHRVGYKFTG